MNKVIKVDLYEAEKIKNDLLEKGGSLRNVKNALWSIKGRGITLTLYKSGKLLIQGKDLKDIESILDKYKLEEDTLEDRYDQYIGIDESGKGDTFGGVVVCGVLISKDIYGKLKNFGIKDSKVMDDIEIEKKLKHLGEYIKAGKLTIKTVNLIPEEYNRLFSLFGNVNSLLLHIYMRILKELVKNVKGETAVLIDKFMEEGKIREELSSLTEGTKLIVESKAEKYVPVALASMIARYKFVRQMEELNKELGMRIPFGSSDPKIKDLLYILKRRNMNISKLAKIHFKNVKETWEI